MAGKRARWQRGRAGYFLSTLNELRRYKNRALQPAAGHRRRRRARSKAGSCSWPSPTARTTAAACRSARTRRLSDGLLDLCLVGDIGRLGALRELPGIYRAAHVNHPLVEIVRVRELRIEGEAETRVHLDGEPFGMLPVDVARAAAAVAVAAPIG